MRADPMPTYRLDSVTADACITLDLPDTFPVDRPIVRPRGGRSTETIAVRTVVVTHPGVPAFDLGGFLLRADGTPTSAARWIKGVTLDAVPEPVRGWAKRAAGELAAFGTRAGALALLATGALHQDEAS